MSNASPIGVAGARERARDLSRVGVETHPMSLIASSAPIPKDSATFPAMKSWRGSAIAVVDPYVGDRENPQMDAELRFGTNLPGATSQRSRRHTPSDLRDRTFSRGGTPRARAFGRPVGYTPHGPLARLEYARQRALDSDSSSGLEQEGPVPSRAPSVRPRFMCPTDRLPYRST